MSELFNSGPLDDADMPIFGLQEFRAKLPNPQPAPVGMAGLAHIELRDGFAQLAAEMALEAFLKGDFDATTKLIYTMRPEATTEMIYNDGVKWPAGPWYEDALAIVLADGTPTLEGLHLHRHRYCDWECSRENATICVWRMNMPGLRRVAHELGCTVQELVERINALPTHDDLQKYYYD